MVHLWLCLPLLAYVILPSSFTEAKNTKLEEVFHWKLVDFDYPDDISRSKSIESKKFIPENNLPLGLDVWKDKLFVTVPRWKSGIPSTLNYVPLKCEWNMCYCILLIWTVLFADHWIKKVKLYYAKRKGTYILRVIHFLYYVNRKVYMHLKLKPLFINVTF